MQRCGTLLAAIIMGLASCAPLGTGAGAGEVPEGFLPNVEPDSATWLARQGVSDGGDLTAGGTTVEFHHQGAMATVTIQNGMAWSYYPAWNSRSGGGELHDLGEAAIEVWGPDLRRLVRFEWNQGQPWVRRGSGSDGLLSLDAVTIVFTPESQGEIRLHPQAEGASLFYRRFFGEDGTLEETGRLPISGGVLGGSGYRIDDGRVSKTNP